MGREEPPRRRQPQVLALPRQDLAAVRQVLDQEPGVVQLDPPPEGRHLDAAVVGMRRGDVAQHDPRGGRRHADLELGLRQRQLLLAAPQIGHQRRPDPRHPRLQRHHLDAPALDPAFRIDRREGALPVGVQRQPERPDRARVQRDIPLAREPRGPVHAQHHPGRNPLPQPRRRPAEGNRLPRHRVLRRRRDLQRPGKARHLVRLGLAVLPHRHRRLPEPLHIAAPVLARHPFQPLRLDHPRPRQLRLAHHARPHRHQRRQRPGPALQWPQVALQTAQARAVVIPRQHAIRPPQTGRDATLAPDPPQRRIVLPRGNARPHRPLVMQVGNVRILRLRTILVHALEHRLEGRKPRILPIRAGRDHLRDPRLHPAQRKIHPVLQRQRQPLPGHHLLQDPPLVKTRVVVHQLARGRPRPERDRQRLPPVDPHQPLNLVRHRARPDIDPAKPVLDPVIVLATQHKAVLRPRHALADASAGAILRRRRRPALRRRGQRRQRRHQRPQDQDNSFQNQGAPSRKA